MTIQDAIRSGRPFRRKGWGNYFERYDNGFLYDDHDGVHNCSVHDLYAEDWEVDGGKITFECEWAKMGVGGMKPKVFPYEPNFDMDQLVGKKTKVTVEILP